MKDIPINDTSMKRRHVVDSVKFAQGKLCLVVDGATLEYSLTVMSPRLAAATRVQRETFEISPGGYGIHWPLIDEDISIDGLLGATVGSASPTTTLRV